MTALPEPLDGLAEKVTKRTGETATHGQLSPLNTYRPSPRQRTAPGSAIADSFVTMLRHTVPHPARLRDQIRRMVKSQERHGRDRYRTTGRMDRRALCRMAVEAPNVFTRRRMTPGVDTAVLLLLDGSGSMTSLAMPTLCLALHLTEAIDAVRGKSAVAVFHGDENRAQLSMLKEFGEAFDARKLAYYTATTSTPLSVAILDGARLLAETPADRRILLVLTDGGCDLGQDCVKAAVAMATRRGIETAGIGIDTDVSYAFPINACVRDIATLATQGLTTLVTALERR
jgi:cobalamin biosynthesis protein CobT